MLGTLSEAVKDARAIERCIGDLLKDYQNMHGVLVNNLFFKNYQDIAGNIQFVTVDIEVCLK